MRRRSWKRYWGLVAAAFVGFGIGCGTVVKTDDGDACVRFTRDGDLFEVDVSVTVCESSSVRDVEHTCDVVLQSSTLQVSSVLTYTEGASTKSDCGGAPTAVCELEERLAPGVYTVRFGDKLTMIDVTAGEEFVEACTD